MKLLKLLPFAVFIFGCNSKISSQITKAEHISLVKEIRTSLGNEGKANIHSIKKLGNYFCEKNKRRELNDFFSMIFSYPPTTLQQTYLEELNRYCIQNIAAHLDEKNMMRLHESLQVARARVLDILEDNMKTSLAVGKYYSLIDSIDFASSFYADVMRIGMSYLDLNYYILRQRDSMYPSSIKLIKRDRTRRPLDILGNHAFHNFIQLYSVDDIRFKMLAKHDYYHFYRKKSSIYFHLMNQKLIAAGYEPIHVVWEKGELVSPLPIKLTKEECRQSYDWIKKKE